MRTEKNAEKRTDRNAEPHWLLVTRREVVSRITDKSFLIGTVLALAAIALSGWIAWQQGRVADTPPPHEKGTDVDRLRFLAKSTLLLAGLSFVAVLFTALPVVFLRDCL